MTALTGNGTAQALNDKLAGLDLTERLALVAELGGRAVFTTSLGIEDQVITAAIGTDRLSIDVVTLETGRLFKETVDLIDETEEQYGITIARYRPVQDDIDAYAAKYGLNGFYESVEARHACCGVRKLKPLARALEGASFWITGLRRGQSGNRADTPFAEFDAERRFGVGTLQVAESDQCHAGEVLQGLLKPNQCPAFGTTCTPRTPLGATMVSSEGACAAYYQFRRLASAGV